MEYYWNNDRMGVLKQNNAEIDIIPHRLKSEMIANFIFCDILNQSRIFRNFE